MAIINHGLQGFSVINPLDYVISTWFHRETHLVRKVTKVTPLDSLSKLGVCASAGLAPDGTFSLGTPVVLDNEGVDANWFWPVRYRVFIADWSEVTTMWNFDDFYFFDNNKNYAVQLIVYALQHTQYDAYHIHADSLDALIPLLENNLASTYPPHFKASVRSIAPGDLVCDRYTQELWLAIRPPPHITSLQWQWRNITRLMPLIFNYPGLL